MVTYLPISSPFVRFAGRFVDEAFGVAVGWNFFIFEAALVPFEIVACNFIIHYWSDAVPAAAIITIVIVLYAYVHSLIVALCIYRFQTPIFLSPRGTKVTDNPLIDQSVQCLCRPMVWRVRILAITRKGHTHRRCAMLYICHHDWRKPLRGPIWVSILEGSWSIHYYLQDGQPWSMARISPVLDPR